MKIHKNDKVIIIAGKDKGKAGKVLQVFPGRNRISVEGLNLLIKHMRPKRQNEKGQRIEFPAPLNVSNMMVVCPKCNKPARIGYKTVETKKSRTTGTENDPGQKETEKKVKITKKKHRVCARCKQVID